MLLQCCYNIVATLKITLYINILTALWQCWKLMLFFQCCHNFVTTLPECYSLVGFQHWATMFTQHCLNIVVWSEFNVGHQRSHNVHTTLYQCCGNVATMLRYDICHQRRSNIEFNLTKLNIVTMLSQSCVFAGLSPA